MPEYDLLLKPGADLSQVIVHVEGASGMSVASDGTLVVETALGPLTQPAPKTWQVDAEGRQHVVLCNFRLLDTDRFGFSAPEWDGDTALTIDPGLIWSTFVGSALANEARAVSVDARGVVTIAGYTSANFPTTRGAYSSTVSSIDAFVSG